MARTKAAFTGGNRLSDYLGMRVIAPVYPRDAVNTTLRSPGQGSRRRIALSFAMAVASARARAKTPWRWRGSATGNDRLRQAGRRGSARHCGTIGANNRTENDPGKRAVNHRNPALSVSR